jgi:hypothetical protein
MHFSMASAVLSIVLVLAGEISASASELRLMDRGVAFGAMGGPSLTTPLQLTGSGGDDGGPSWLRYTAEGAASIGVELGIWLGVNIYFWSSWSDAIAANDTTGATGIDLAWRFFNFSSSLIIPLATTFIVNMMSETDGYKTDYWRTYLWSIGARIGFALLPFILSDTAGQVVRVLGIFAGATAEVYAAHSLGRKDAPMATPTPVAPAALRAAEADRMRVAAMALPTRSVQLLAFAF